MEVSIKKYNKAMEKFNEFANRFEKAFPGMIDTNINFTKKVAGEKIKALPPERKEEFQKYIEEFGKIRGEIFKSVFGTELISEAEKKLLIKLLRED